MFRVKLSYSSVSYPLSSLLLGHMLPCNCSRWVLERKAHPSAPSIFMMPHCRNTVFNLALKPAVTFSNDAGRLPFIPTLHLPFSSPLFMREMNTTVVRISCVYNVLVTSKWIENSIPGFLLICFLDRCISLRPRYTWCWISEKGIALQHPSCVCLLVFQCIIRGNCRFKKKKLQIQSYYFQNRF